MVKETLSSVDTLTDYDPLTLACDASPVGVGAVILHVFPDNTEKPIAYGLHKLTKAKANYAKGSLKHSV